MAAAILLLLDPSLWRALVVSVLLACPVIAIWGLFAGMWPLPFPIGPVPATRGRTLDWIAPYYDFACRCAGLGPEFRQRTIAAVQLHSGDTVLDVGCGTGVLTRLAANAVRPAGQAWGVDPAPDMIRIARIDAANAGSGAKFKPGVIENLDFDADTVDAAFLSLVLHHLPLDLKQSGLQEIRRVLKPGGRVLIVDLDRHTPDLLRAAGFVHITQLGRWAAVLTFWVAHKPSLEETL